jgi:hypothetical protein
VCTRAWSRAKASKTSEPRRRSSSRTTLGIRALGHDWGASPARPTRGAHSRRPQESDRPKCSRNRELATTAHNGVVRHHLDTRSISRPDAPDLERAERIGESSFRHTVHDAGTHNVPCPERPGRMIQSRAASGLSRRRPLDHGEVSGGPGPAPAGHSGGLQVSPLPKSPRLSCDALGDMGHARRASIVHTRPSSRPHSVRVAGSLLATGDCHTFLTALDVGESDLTRR